MCINERQIRGVRRPVSQQSFVGDAGVSVHGRQEGQGRAISSHLVHQNQWGVRWVGINALSLFFLEIEELKLGKYVVYLNSS